MEREKDRQGVHERRRESLLVCACVRAVVTHKHAQTDIQANMRQRPTNNQDGQRPTDRDGQREERESLVDDVRTCLCVCVFWLVGWCGLGGQIKAETETDRDGESE